MPRLGFFSYTQPSDRDRSHLFSQSHMQQAALHMASEFSNTAKPTILNMFSENLWRHRLREAVLAEDTSIIIAVVLVANAKI